MRPGPEHALRVEPFTIGTSWYQYDGRTHILTAWDETWAVVHDDGAFALQVRSYYDERGTSGLPSFDVRHWDESANAWAAPRVVRTTSNIKDGRVCLDLDDGAEVACGNGAHELVLRTERRAVPPAGFAIQNPAFYLAEHLPAPHVVRLDGSPNRADLPDPASLRALPALRSAQHDPTAGYIMNDPDGTWDQALGSMTVARWRRTAATDTSMTFEARCVPAGVSRDATQPLSEAPLRTGTIDFEPGQLVLATLCAGDAPATLTTGERGWDASWPDTGTFDLMIDARHSPPALLAAPGAPFIAVRPDDQGLLPAALSIELWRDEP